eukprot:679631-Rhodomonas_salina.3
MHSTPSSAEQLTWRKRQQYDAVLSACMQWSAQPRCSFGPRMCSEGRKEQTNAALLGGECVMPSQGEGGSTQSNCHVIAYVNNSREHHCGCALLSRICAFRIDKPSGASTRSMDKPETTTTNHTREEGPPLDLKLEMK